MDKYFIGRLRTASLRFTNASRVRCFHPFLQGPKARGSKEHAELYFFYQRYGLRLLAVVVAVRPCNFLLFHHFCDGLIFSLFFSLFVHSWPVFCHFCFLLTIGLQRFALLHGLSFWFFICFKLNVFFFFY